MEGVIEQFIACVIDFIFGSIMIMMLFFILNNICGGVYYV